MRAMREAREIAPNANGPTAGAHAAEDRSRGPDCSVDRIVSGPGRELLPVERGLVHHPAGIRLSLQVSAKPSQDVARVFAEGVQQEETSFCPHAINFLNSFLLGSTVLLVCLFDGAEP